MQSSRRRRQPVVALWLTGRANSTNRFPCRKGRQLVTLRDAAEYIQKLPKAEQLLEEWHAAVEAQLLVVELNGPTMTAAPITSAGRFSPLGPRGIRNPHRGRFERTLAWYRRNHRQ